MILIKIPDWCNYIVIELDNTIHAHRYEPNTLNNKIITTIKKYEDTEQYELLAIIHGENLEPGTTKVNAVIENMDRYLNSDIEIVTKDNQNYKEFTLETFLTKQGE